MYNGVGLPTPRGSGTSGYVQPNLAYVSRPRTWVEFKKEFEQIKANPPKPPKKPNAEIIEHEQKREIEVNLLRFRDKLEAEGLRSEEIEGRVIKARTYLYCKMKEAPLIVQASSHQRVAEKEREMERLKAAFGIMDSYAPGSAFDFEAIEEKQQKEKEERQLKKALEAREKELAVLATQQTAKVEVGEKEPARESQKKERKSVHGSVRAAKRSERAVRKSHHRSRSRHISDSRSSSRSSSSSDSRSSSARRERRKAPYRRRRE